MKMIIIRKIILRSWTIHRLRIYNRYIYICIYICLLHACVYSSKQNFNLLDYFVPRGYSFYLPCNLLTSIWTSISSVVVSRLFASLYLLFIMRRLLNLDVMLVITCVPSRSTMQQVCIRLYNSSLLGFRCSAIARDI